MDPRVDPCPSNLDLLQSEHGLPTTSLSHWIHFQYWRRADQPIEKSNAACLLFFFPSCRFPGLLELSIGSGYTEYIRYLRFHASSCLAGCNPWKQKKKAKKGTIWVVIEGEKELPDWSGQARYESAMAPKRAFLRGSRLACCCSSCLTICQSKSAVLSSIQTTAIDRKQTWMEMAASMRN